MTNPPLENDPNAGQAALLFFKIMKRELAANTAMIIANYHLSPTDKLILSELVTKVGPVQPIELAMATALDVVTVEQSLETLQQLELIEGTPEDAGTTWDIRFTDVQNIGTYLG